MKEEKYIDSNNKSQVKMIFDIKEYKLYEKYIKYPRAVCRFYIYHKNKKILSQMFSVEGGIKNVKTLINNNFDKFYVSTITNFTNPNFTSIELIQRL